MNIVQKLTLRHLRRNFGRTIITIVGIMLSVAMVCCVAGFVMSLRKLLLREVKAGVGDYHVVYYDVTPETAQQIAQEDIFATYYMQDSSFEGWKHIYLRFEKPGSDILAVADDIAQKYGDLGWDTNNELLALEGVMPQDTVMRAFTGIAVVAILIIVAGSVIVIANAFNISSSERTRQFGLLKSAGATGRQLGRSVLFEAGVLAAIAIPVGIALGFLIQAVILRLTNGLLAEISKHSHIDIAFHVVFEPVIILISVGIAVLTVLISAWLPARRVAAISPIDAIRQTKDIRIRANQLKTARLTQRVFGFEGTLAAKSLKRNRGKYRAAVISLTASVVLFVSMSSFVSTLNKSAEMEYGGSNFDVMIYVTGLSSMSSTELDDIDRRLRSIPDAEIIVNRATHVEATVPEGFFTKQALEYNYPYPSLSTRWLSLCAIPDDDFAKIAPGAGNGLQGILVNTTGAFHLDNQVIEFVPYQCVPGTELPLRSLAHNSSEETVALGSVIIAAVIDHIPDSFSAFGVEGNILVSESAYKSFFLEHEEVLKETSNIQYSVTAADPDAFCQTAEKKLAAYCEYGYVSINDLSQMARFNRNIVLIVMIFGYGFIGMLSLIAGSSVIATISTGMTLRRQEFALLYSAGMTPKGMNKMLNLESLLYGLKSLLFGLPLGVALSYLINLAINNLVTLRFQPPWAAMAISVAAVLLLTFGTMRYGKKKLNKVSIVEAIRNETV